MKDWLYGVPCRTVARCDLCGEKAGWFESRHPACIALAEETRTKLIVLVRDGVLNGEGYDNLHVKIEQILATCKFSFDRYRDTFLQTANDAATEIAKHSPIAESELKRLVSVLQRFGIDAYTSEWAQRKWFGMAFVSMSHTLWQVLNNVTPYYDPSGRMQFNLAAGELPVFSVGKATFAEERIVHSPRTFSGLSLPIGGGAYYHIGGSQEESVSGLLPIDMGEILITNRALYFGGQKKTMRLVLSRVVRFQAYVDGIGVCESHGAPKVFVPDYSGMDTGWFFFNLLTALASQQ